MHTETDSRHGAFIHECVECLTLNKCDYDNTIIVYFAGIFCDLGPHDVANNLLSNFNVGTAGS